MVTRVCFINSTGIVFIILYSFLPALPSQRIFLSHPLVYIIVTHTRTPTQTLAHLHTHTHAHIERYHSLVWFMSLDQCLMVPTSDFMVFSFVFAGFSAFFMIDLCFGLFVCCQTSCIS